MRRPRIAKIWFFGSRNKWAKRGRNTAHFLMSFFFYTFAYILYGIMTVVKWLFLLIFSGVSRVISWKFKKKELSADGQKYNAQSHIVLPDRFTRLKVIMTQLENKPIEDNLNVGTIIDLTVGYSEADLAGVVNRAMQKAFSRSIKERENGVNSICEQDFLLAIEELRPAFEKNQ